MSMYYLSLFGGWWSPARQLLVLLRLQSRSGWAPVFLNSAPLICLAAGLGSPKQLGARTSGAPQAFLPITVWSLHMDSSARWLQGSWTSYTKAQASGVLVPGEWQVEVNGLLWPSLTGHTSLFLWRCEKSCLCSRGGDIDPSSWWQECQRIYRFALKPPWNLCFLTCWMEILLLLGLDLFGGNGRINRANAMNSWPKSPSWPGVKGPKCPSGSL